jgi:hypothetical protein
MRTLMRVTLDVEATNAAIEENVLQELLQSTLQELKPEAAYFFADHGKRTAYIFFDLQETSQMPVIAEPMFRTLHATVEFVPVMNANDLRTGLERVTRTRPAAAPAAAKR